MGYLDGIPPADPTAETAVHRPDDRFVPAQPDHLLMLLIGECGQLQLDSNALRQVFGLLQRTFDHELLATERALLAAYEPFHPDADTQAAQDKLLRRTPAAYAEFETRVASLLEKANFERLSRVQVDAAIRVACSRGLQVRLRPERVASLSVWVRGRGSLTRNVRSLRRPLRGSLEQRAVFRRLVLVGRLRDDPHVLLKLFKEIPVTDVEALLPHAEVEMSLKDRILVYGGGSGTLATVGYKLMLGSAAALAQLLWIVIVPLATMSVRLFLGYRRARNERNYQRTSNLYFQNLGNNASVLHSICWMISQEELKEALLTYWFAYSARHEVLTPDLLAARIQSFLQRKLQAPVDFDLADAIHTLARLGLWADAEHLRVVTPDQAIALLEAGDRLSGSQPSQRHPSYYNCSSAGEPERDKAIAT